MGKSSVVRGSGIKGLKSAGKSIKTPVGKMATSSNFNLKGGK